MMSEEDMIKAVQVAVDDAGIDDTIREVGQFEPRGMTGSLFAGGFIGDELAGSIGGAVGSVAGMHANAASRGLPMHMMVGASDTTIYGFRMEHGRKSPPHDMVFRVPRADVKVNVRARVNVRVLELVDEATASKIELEGNRIPITHSHDLIRFVAGPEAISEADAQSE
jgi:hypothetical protein